MADGEPRLHELIRIVETFNLSLIHRYIDLGAEWIGYPEDLGMQNGPMISPAHFCRYIKPVYQRLMQPAREAGCIVHMHSDGDIRTLVDDLIEGGVQVINLQDLVNGINWIAERFAGRVCIDLDIDRQAITRFGTPAQIDALIREEVSKLGRKEGGLMMVYGLYPGVPLQNVRALMDAMTRYATFYA
jgi:uroporphyrinogen-III decarboxylase